MWFLLLLISLRFHPTHGYSPCGQLRNYAMTHSELDEMKQLDCMYNCKIFKGYCEENYWMIQNIDVGNYKKHTLERMVFPEILIGFIPLLVVNLLNLLVQIRMRFGEKVDANQTESASNSLPIPLMVTCLIHCIMCSFTGLHDMVLLVIPFLVYYSCLNVLVYVYLSGMITVLFVIGAFSGVSWSIFAIMIATSMIISICKFINVRESYDFASYLVLNLVIGYWCVGFLSACKYRGMINFDSYGMLSILPQAIVGYGNSMLFYENILDSALIWLGSCESCKLVVGFISIAIIQVVLIVGWCMPRILIGLHYVRHLGLEISVKTLLHGLWIYMIDPFGPFELTYNFVKGNKRIYSTQQISYIVIGILFTWSEISYALDFFCLRIMCSFIDKLVFDSLYGRATRFLSFRFAALRDSEFRAHVDFLEVIEAVTKSIRKCKGYVGNLKAKNFYGFVMRREPGKNDRLWTSKNNLEGIASVRIDKHKFTIKDEDIVAIATAEQSVGVSIRDVSKYSCDIQRMGTEEANRIVRVFLIVPSTGDGVPHSVIETDSYSITRNGDLSVSLDLSRDYNGLPVFGMLPNNVLRYCGCYSYEATGVTPIALGPPDSPGDDSSTGSFDVRNAHILRLIDERDAVYAKFQAVRLKLLSGEGYLDEYDKLSGEWSDLLQDVNRASPTQEIENGFRNMSTMVLRDDQWVIIERKVDPSIDVCLKVFRNAKKTHEDLLRVDKVRWAETDSEVDEEEDLNVDE